MLKSKKDSINLATYIPVIGAAVFLIILTIIFGVLSEDFRQPSNLVKMLRQASINGLIAFGMTGVVLTGAIDLSVGSTLGLTAMLTAFFIKFGLPFMGIGPIAAPIAMLLALVIGILLGMVSGLLVSKGEIQPFIATLVTMTIFRGFTLVISGGKPISNLGDNFLLNDIGKGTHGLPTPVWILLIAFLIYGFVLSKTTLGRRIYAVGSNEVAANLAGVKVDRIKIIVYAVSGFFAALAGLILLSRLGSAQPTLGASFEMDAIAATAIGGTSLNGGRGKLIGTFIGLLFIAILNNGLNILGVSSYVQDIVKGLAILVAVLFDRIVKKLQ